MRPVEVDQSLNYKRPLWMWLAKFYEVSLKFTLMKTSKVNGFQLNPATKEVNQKGLTIKKLLLNFGNRLFIYLYYKFKGWGF